MLITSKVKQSLQIKVIFAVVFLTLGIQGLVSVIKIRYERQEAFQQLEIDRERILRELSHSLNDPLWNYDIEQTKALIHLKFRERGFLGIVIHDLDTNSKIIELFRDKGKIVETIVPLTNDTTMRTIDIRKKGIVYWKADCYFTDTYLKEKIYEDILFSLFTILGLTLFLILLLITALQSLVIAPIQVTTSFIKTIAKGDFSKRIQVKQSDEIGEIGEAVNRFVEQLQDGINETNRVMEAMATGHFTPRITAYLEGDLKKLKNHANQSIELLSERTEQLNKAQQELIDKAHKAGMAEIASGTLHNVGNILNSVKISAQMIRKEIDHSDLQYFTKANDLIREHIDNLDLFIQEDPKGKKLLAYYLKLEESFNEEKRTIEENVNRLIDKIDMIADVISAQQSYAGFSFVTEEFPLESVIEDALTLQSRPIEHARIKVVKEFDSSVMVPIQKAKLIHILINLIKNAKESMSSIPETDRVLTISAKQSAETVILKIADSGKGIAPGHLKRIFTHGFTTKKEGHGFGLHSCANYMADMGGKIWVENNENGQGASFYLELPLNPPNTSTQN